MDNTTVVTNEKPRVSGFTADVLLVDIATLSHEFRARYPVSKVLLMDTRTAKEKLRATLRSFRISPPVRS